MRGGVRVGGSGRKTGVGGTWWMWFYHGGCSRAAWVEGCFRRHEFHTWARGEQRTLGMVNSYQVCVRGRGKQCAGRRDRRQLSVGNNKSKNDRRKAEELCDPVCVFLHCVYEESSHQKNSRDSIICLKT